ncbi:peptidoglycan editing factor PgeF [Massilia sp. NR 4-1]|uniref:peptidoglycan editing factor PgeF n=1 Tax=Massilia sp. NR 4-1 TaxID=1678028 RepID=UPI0009E41F3E|nr:peptidoglycan editing factor PgeF [Massilia sp. NR 4-1]
MSESRPNDIRPSSGQSDARPAHAVTGSAGGPATALAHDAASDVRRDGAWLRPVWPGLPANIGVLCTTRLGGVSVAPYGLADGVAGGLNLGVHVGDDPASVARNRAVLRAELPAEPVWLSQVHGIAVADADAAAQAVPEADASVARQAGTVCAILTADCLPVLFCDVRGTVIGAAHAGWRSLAGGVLQETVKAMRAAGAGEVMAWLGPAIGPDRFEVGAEVREAFLDGAGDEASRREVEAAFRLVPGQPGKFLADIYALARSVLRRVGVEQVSGGQQCTVSDPSLFYSYRRDGITGRQASLIWIK